MFHWGAFNNAPSVYVVEVNGSFGAGECEWTQIAPGDKMLVLIGCHVVDLRSRPVGATITEGKFASLGAEHQGLEPTTFPESR